MPLTFRAAQPAEYPFLEKMVIDAFEPITWFREVQRVFGLLNGMDWRQRWQKRMQQVFATEILLVGEAGGEIAAFASGSVDVDARLGHIDLLAVDRRFQGSGYGREMLRGMLQHLKSLGAVHAQLECLTTNETGNSLYRAEGFTEMARQIHWFIQIP